MKDCLIMLIDDDDDDQMIFKLAINEINNEVNCICHSSAELALKSLQEKTEKPKCIFLDLHLPLMQGLELLDLLKASKELQDIPVIIYSTSSRETDKTKALNLGATCFITKPTSYEQIKTEVSFVLNGRGGNKTLC